MNLRLLIEAQCGRLAWLCCLGDFEQWKKARDLLSGMSDADLETLHMAICACPVPGGGGTPPPPPTQKPTCFEKARQWLCSGTTLAMITSMKSATDFIIPGTTMDEPVGQFIVLIKGMVDAVNTACTNPSESNIMKAAEYVCKAIEAAKVIEGKIESQPEPIKSVLLFLVKVIAGTGFAAQGDAYEFLKECCAKTPTQPASGDLPPPPPAIPGVPGGSAQPYPPGVIMTATPSDAGPWGPGTTVDTFYPQTQAKVVTTDGLSLTRPSLSTRVQRTKVEYQASIVPIEMAVPGQRGKR